MADSQDAEKTPADYFEARAAAKERYASMFMRTPCCAERFVPEYEGVCVTYGQWEDRVVTYSCAGCNNEWHADGRPMIIEVPVSEERCESVYFAEDYDPKGADDA